MATWFVLACLTLLGCCVILLGKKVNSYFVVWIGVIVTVAGAVGGIFNVVGKL